MLALYLVCVGKKPANDNFGETIRRPVGISEKNMLTSRENKGFLFRKKKSEPVKKMIKIYRECVLKFLSVHMFVIDIMYV